MRNQLGAWREVDSPYVKGMAPEENVTTLLYRRRRSNRGVAVPEFRDARTMAFDPLLVFTSVLVGGAVVGQMVLLIILDL